MDTETEPPKGQLERPRMYTYKQGYSTSRNQSTRAVPLSFRANKDLTISHSTVGRKSRGRLLAVGHFASWHLKKTIIQSAILIIVFFGVPKSLIARKDRGSARVDTDLKCIS